MAYQIEIENYYEILELPRKASFEEINSQFQSLALRYHPMRNPTNMQANQMKFAQICEAHDVLSNGTCPYQLSLLSILTDICSLITVESKAIFDIYGEYGLKEGCVTP